MTPPLDQSYYNGLTLNTEIISGNSYGFIDFKVFGGGLNNGFSINITNPNNQFGVTLNTIDSSYILRSDPSAQTTYGYTLINSNAVSISQGSIIA